MSYKSHLFICTNSPDKSGKCGSKNSEALKKELKEKCKEAFGKDVRVSSSGCLGYCERGIAAVVYPDAKWLFDLEDSDGDQIFKAVKKSVEGK